MSWLIHRRAIYRYLSWFKNGSKHILTWSWAGNHWALEHPTECWWRFLRENWWLIETTPCVLRAWQWGDGRYFFSTFVVLIPVTWARRHLPHFQPQETKDCRDQLERRVVRGNQGNETFSRKFEFLIRLDEETFSVASGPGEEVTVRHIFLSLLLLRLSYLSRRPGGADIDRGDWSWSSRARSLGGSKDGLWRWEECRE